ncbi:MAG: AzlC family ABC transporter permease [Lachnospiraceae bacterium]
MLHKKNEYTYAFTQTIPVLLGYIFLGIAFGLMLQDAGYNWLWAFLISLCVYAGSMQFVLVTLLAGGASLLSTFAMTLFINGRHIFYGLSFIEKYKKMGRAYPYMVFSLTDETYSVLCSLKVPEGMDEKKVSFMISALDQLYWIAGSVAGALIGQMITLDTTGIDFSMTALFVVIVVNQWLENKNHFPAIVGFVAAVLSLLLLGPDKFLLPALTLSMMILLIFRSVTGGEEDAA